MGPRFVAGCGAIVRMNRPGFPETVLFEPPTVRGPAPAVSVLVERYGIGFTDIVKHPTAGCGEFRPREFREGALSDPTGPLWHLAARIVKERGRRHSSHGCDRMETSVFIGRRDGHQPVNRSPESPVTRRYIRITARPNGYRAVTRPRMRCAQDRRWCDGALA